MIRIKRQLPPRIPRKPKRHPLCASNFKQDAEISMQILEDANWEPLFCSEELPTMFEPIAPYHYELQFLTGRRLSRVTRDYRIRLNDEELYKCVIFTITQDTGIGLDRFQRASLVMEVLISMAENDWSSRRFNGRAVLLEHPLFETMRERLGLLRLCTSTTRLTTFNKTAVLSHLVIPLFEEDELILPRTAMQPPPRYLYCQPAGD